MKLVQSIVFVAALLLPAYAAAQACPDGTPDGDVSANNTCQVCYAGELKSLPERTTCKADRAIHCDGTNIYRWECVATDDPAVTECAKNDRWDECPGGIVCNTDNICEAVCATNSDCRSGFECRGDSCFRISTAPDMGGGSDMGGGESDMGSSSDMGGSADMSWKEDTGDSYDVGDQPDAEPVDVEPKKADAGGCSSANGSVSFASLLTILFVFLRRRRSS